MLILSVWYLLLFWPRRHLEQLETTQ